LLTAGELSLNWDGTESEAMAKLNEQLVKIVEDYRKAGGEWPATREQIAEWAVANER